MPTILICGSFWLGSLEESYARGFESIGWKVERLDLMARAGSSLIDKVARYALQSRDAKRVLRAVLDRIQLCTPDVMFVIKGVHLPASHLRSIKSRLKRSPLINFNPDSPWEKLNSSAQVLESIEVYDHHFTWSQRLIPSFYHYEAKAVHYLPFAYDPTLHFPVEELRTAEFEAAFIGSYDRHRDKLLAELDGCNLGIWGNGWNRARYSPHRWIQSEAVYGEAATRLLSRSVCALNILRPQNEGSHNMRTFEIPATRNIMITNRTEEQSHFLLEGREMLCYSNPSELIECIKNVNRDPELADRIREAAYLRIHEETYAKRAGEIVATLGLHS